MKAGKYWIGDLCYVMHGEWDEFCALTIKDNECLEGEFSLADGRAFAHYGTKWGDGEYRDQYGREYGVDAGLIGCILLSDIDQDNASNDISLGNIITFPEDFQVSYSDGVITFGSLIDIDTDPEYQDEDYDYFENEEEEEF